MMTTGNDHITSLIPQRKPFVMVDALLRSGDTVTTSTFRIPADNIFVEAGFFKEPGLVENIAQTVAARAGYEAQQGGKPVAIGYIGSVRNLEVFFLPAVDDELETEVTVENQVFNVTIVSGKITCREKTVAQCQMKIFIDQP